MNEAQEFQEVYIQSELTVPPSKILGLVGVVVVGNLVTYTVLAALKVYATRKMAVDPSEVPEAETARADSTEVAEAPKPAPRKTPAKKKPAG